MIQQIPFLPGECWWGGAVIHANEMPFTEQSDFSFDLRRPVGSSNQMAPLLVSSKGRYIWCDEPFGYAFCHGMIELDGENIVMKRVGSTLRDAYMGAMAAHFPFDGRQLEDAFFLTAQYNGWMQFLYEPTQEGVLDYAHGIVDNGFSPGILMIDEGWSAGYGDLTFDLQRFPDPKAMIRELHDLGFKIMLWVTPYFAVSGLRYLQLTRFRAPEDKLFMRNANGDVALMYWWNGVCAVLDMTRESDRRFMDEQLQTLMNEYGVDGFKFDGGSVMGYLQIANGEPDPSHTAHERNMAWNAFGRRYPFHEYKDSYHQGGRNSIQRLRDKTSTWTGVGINTLTPAAVTVSLMGTPFICPDMIGGGEWSYFRYTLNRKMDQELFVRMTQCSVFLPMMQFSLAPWEVLDDKHLAICQEMTRLHAQLAPYILSLVRESETSGEPIVRHLAYQFPDEGLEACQDCFMLGDRYLVAPVVIQGATTRTLTLPAGQWKYVDATIYSGGEVTVDAPIDVLPYFERVI